MRTELTRIHYYVCDDTPVVGLAVLLNGVLLRRWAANQDFRESLHPWLLFRGSGCRILVGKIVF